MNSTNENDEILLPNDKEYYQIKEADKKYFKPKYERDDIDSSFFNPKTRFSTDLYVGEKPLSLQVWNEENNIHIHEDNNLKYNDTKDSKYEKLSPKSNKLFDEKLSKRNETFSKRDMTYK